MTEHARWHYSFDANVTEKRLIRDVCCLIWVTSFNDVAQVFVTGSGDAVSEVLQVVQLDVPDALGSGAYEQHLLPYVPDIVRHVDLNSQLVSVTPPDGLLELGRRDSRLRQLKQELQVQSSLCQVAFVNVLVLAQCQRPEPLCVAQSLNKPQPLYPQ